MDSEAVALEEFVYRTNLVGVADLCDEFLALKVDTQLIGKKPKTAFDANPEKNRSKDVYCLDASRVKLSFPDGSNDYIHANWVDGKRIICTQGPTENTVEDLWRMVWQEKCGSITMLCNEMEGGMKKCERYWPDKDRSCLSFLEGKLTVRFIDSKDLEVNLRMTSVELSYGEQIHPVDHFHWLDWPDRGVPSPSLSLIRLLDRTDSRTPSVVHCSAGIGRTGTLVGIDIAYRRMQRGKVWFLNDIVREMRGERHAAVQTDVQYLFMHRILLDLAVEKKAVTAADIAKFVRDYDELPMKGGVPPKEERR